MFCKQWFYNLFKTLLIYKKKIPIILRKWHLTLNKFNIYCYVIVVFQSIKQFSFLVFLNRCKVKHIFFKI